MKIQTRANYRNESKIGSITVSKIIGNRPFEYILQLFENSSIKLSKNKFTTISLAITHSCQYGYLPNLWNIEEIEI